MNSDRPRSTVPESSTAGDGSQKSGTDGSPAVVLLADEPSSSDDFDAKAHDQVARAIANLIEHEPGGGVIGLEGTWGSGKSTVVELLCEHLRPASAKKQLGHIRTVVFDAWAHQNDPLRRTFLEKVIDELSDAEWLPSSDADAFRKKLSGRASQVHTKSSARLSPEGWFTSAAALLIPLGSALLQNKFHSHHRAAQILGLVLLLGPLIVVLGFLAAKAFGIVLGGRRPGQSAWRRTLANIRPFSFFAKEQDNGWHREQRSYIGRVRAIVFQGSRNVTHSAQASASRTRQPRSSGRV